MEKDGEISNQTLQPVSSLRPLRRELPEISTVPDLSQGIGPPGRDPGGDEGQLVKR